MKNILKKILYIVVYLLIVIVLLYTYFQMRSTPNNIEYGVSFNTLYARELGLDPYKTYDAILDDLNVKHLRLAAHWNMVEPEDDKYNFKELDYQINKAEEVGADVILGVGRRLPRWPECHIPEWAWGYSWEDQKIEIEEYIEAVVLRYKDREHIVQFQVENEPFLSVFAEEHCGDLDVDFLDREIELVKELAPLKDILVTDSGNLGTWAKPYRRGDVFGTSVYVYLWNPDIGPFKSFLPPSFYRAKTSLMEHLFGKKESILVELSLEPWLLQPVAETSRELQLERMNMVKFNEIIEFAKETKFERQYLWGAEWWYFMKEDGYDDFWDRAKEVFNEES
ncbi:MAG: hypothetical protein ACI9GH_000610 [Candidatus Paceibacteria bacterium]|jgi:hypothetical protein